VISVFGFTVWSSDTPTNSKLTQTRNPELKNWMILILKPKNIVYQYYPFTGKVIKSVMEENHFDCQAANAVLKVILCNDMMINYHTGKIITRNVPYIGPISPDGRYIIASGGTAIYDIKNRKTISYYPKGKSDDLYTKGGVPYAKKILVGRKNVRYHQLSDTEYLTFMYPTTPKPNGRFLAFRLSSPGGNRFTKYIYEYNLYEIIKKKGVGFKAKRRPLYDNDVWNRSSRSYVGYKKFLWTRKLASGKIIPIISRSKDIDDKDNTRFSAGIVSFDGKWGVIFLTYKLDRNRLAIYNIKDKKIEIDDLGERYHLPTGVSTMFWVWIGDPKKHPGFVDY